MDLRQNLWTFKHEPQRFQDIVINEDIRPKLLKALDDLPNMLIYGTPGIGKGSGSIGRLTSGMNTGSSQNQATSVRTITSV